MIDIVSLQLTQTRRLPFQATPIFYDLVIFSSTGELDKWNSDDPTPLNEGCEFSLRGGTYMEIEKAAAEISNLPRDEDENQDADRHQGNNCAPGNAHVFSST
jgi:hypothetical protein